MYYQLNNLSNLSDKEIIDKIKKLPEDASSLGLHNNNFGNKPHLKGRTCHSLSNILAAIAKNVIKLDLEKNLLGQYFKGNELRFIFSHLPRHLTSLNLCNNYLDLQETNALERALEALPISLTSLNLSQNNLGNKTGTDLAKIFLAIHPNITSLDLSANLLANLNVTEMEKLNNSLPHVQKIYLSRDDITAMSADQLDALKAAFPNVRIVVLTEKVSNIGYVYRADNNLWTKVNDDRKYQFPTKFPSLLEICSFFVKKHTINSAKLNEELKDYLYHYGCYDK